MTDPLFTKDPDAVLDYAFDWSVWLETGETITAHTVTADTGVTVDSSTEADGVVTMWLSGGTPGPYVKVVCHVTTSAGRQDDRTMTVLVADR